MHPLASPPSAERRQFVRSPRRLGRSLFLGSVALLTLAIASCSGSTRSTGNDSDDDDNDGSGGASSSSTTTASTGGVGGATTSTGSMSSSATGTGGSTPIVDECGPIGEIGEIDLGDISMAVSSPFTICKNTVGFTALATSPTEADIIGVARLKPPDGGSVILNFAMANHTTAVFGKYGWIAAQNPQSNSADAFPTQAGEWRITLGDDDGSISQAHTSVWYRRTNDGLFHGGVVDVNVFLVAGAASQSSIQSVVDEMFPYAGMQQGTVTFYPLADSYNVVSSQQELENMFQESAGITSMPALNLFVIGDFGATFGDAIGIAGGIPGSPMKPGTGMSGVAYQPSGNISYDASVLRHEVGHLSGLFHTTEYYSENNVHETDPLDDTPQCSHTTMVNNPEGCPDASNSMFPIAFGAVTFTSAQELVLHGSMLYRTILEDGGSAVPPQPVSLKVGAKELVPLAPETLTDLEHAARRPAKAWRTATDSLERVLGGVWCAHGGADYTDLVIRMAGPAALDRLRGLALDEGAPEIVRARALTSYVRAAERAGLPSALKIALDLASSIAKEDAASTDLRVAALRALAPHKTPAARAARLTAVATKDAVVRAVALDLSASEAPSPSH